MPNRESESQRQGWVTGQEIALQWVGEGGEGDKENKFGHFLRGRSLKGRCNIRVYVPACVPVYVCVCVCVSLRSPLTPPIQGWPFPPSASASVFYRCFFRKGFFPGIAN